MKFGKPIQVVLIVLSCLVLSACNETETETDTVETVRSHSHNDYYLSLIHI